MEQPVHILHVLGNTQLGGAESRIMDLYRHLDRDKVQFDFVVHSKEEGHFNDEIRELGGRIFRVPRFRLINYFSYRRAWKKLLKEHCDRDGSSEFRMIQGHMTSTAAIYLPIAKRCGIETTIAHARSAGVDRGAKGILTRFLRRNLARKADHLFTCSELAGISVFGKRAVEQGRTRFLPNAIDCKRFAWNPEVRKELRRELQLEDCYVIGHVGRFHYAKNHEYLIRVFAELVKRNTRDYALVLLGEGGGMEGIRKLAGELGVADRVHFLGNKSNIYDYYQMMDHFVYPSRFEGMPGTIVEAQTAGLPCLMSDTICREVIATDLVRTMSIEAAPECWADAIEQYAEHERTGRVEEMTQKGFDVNGQAEKLTDFYTKPKLLLMSPMLHQGGFERVCITTARLLQPHYDVTILIFDDANIAYDISGLNICNIHLGVRRGKLQKLWNILRRSVRVRRIKKYQRPVLTYSFGPTANMVNVFSKGKSEKVWVGLRNYTDVEERIKMRLFVKKADRIVCCSKDIEAKVKEMSGKAQTSVLYNLYDTEQIRREADAKDPKLPFEGENLRILVSMGRDDPMKGFSHMVKAFKVIHDAVPSARLILMGAGNFEKYKKLARELGVSDEIYFAGMQREPYSYLKYGEIYLLTSRNEGFPNALVEAMALSLAPVSTNCLTGPAEILVRDGNTTACGKLFEEKRRRNEAQVLYGEYGVLLPAMSPEEDLQAAVITEEERRYADEVIRLLTHEEELLRYQQTAAERAGDFTYEAYLAQLLTLIGKDTGYCTHSS